MAGSGGANPTPTAVANTAMRWSEEDRRGPDNSTPPQGWQTQPRMLQPITTKANLTVANGFKPANLRPADMVCTLTEETGVVTLNIRNAANNGWYQINISGTGSAVTVTSLEVADA